MDDRPRTTDHGPSNRNTLALRLLGTPQILLDQQPTTIKSLKARALLFYVAMAQAPVPRETLVALLWPNSAASTARSNLRTQLATLRKVLPDHLITTRQSVTLADKATVDVRHFITAPAAQHALYRGDFLAGFSVGDSAEYDHWQTGQREYLRLLAIEAHQQLVAKHSADPATALSYARDWVSLAPLQEAAHRAVIRQLLATNNRAEALHQYQTCAQLLQAELGITPSPETQALHAQLQNGHQQLAPSHQQPATNPTRQHLLSKLQTFWLDGVLQDNVPANASIDLDFANVPDQIDHPWADSLGTHFLTRKDADANGLALTLAQSENSLLILGEPGSGKTISLLQLAATLHGEATVDKQAALPVILHLASWANQQADFGAWVASEIKAKYQLPADSAETILDQNALILLLDGLDEMNASTIPACIRAINSFRQDRPRVGLVVCCRSADYVRAASRFQLNAAVQLQPLGRRQINRYLAQTQASTQLRASLLSERSDPLHELAQSPIMLSLMRHAGTAGGAASDAQQLIAAYIDHAFERKPNAAQPAKVRQQMGWLAQHMRANNQSHFLIEALQPSWLDARRHRLLYLASNALVMSLVAVLVFAISVVYIWYRTNQQFEITYFCRIATALSISYPTACLLGMLLLSIPTYLIGLLRQAALWERQRNQPPQPLSAQKQWLDSLIAGLIPLLVIAGVIGAFGDPAAGLVLGAIIGMARIGSSRTWLSGTGYVDDIQQADKIGWSWRKAAIGPALGFAHGIVWYLAVPDLPDWYDVPTAMLLFVFVLGLQGERIESKTRPNLGTWLALRNGLISAVLISVVIGSLITAYAQVQAALAMALSLFVAGYLLQGGVNAIKHGILRLILSISAETPLNYAAFLDNACTYGFLQRVGGGYVFRHRLILDHFASLSASQRQS